MSQSESDIGCSYSFKSIESRLDCLEKDTANLRAETDNLRVETDILRVETDNLRVDTDILKEDLLYPLLIRELLEQSM
jgi:hypothetical protein